MKKMSEFDTSGIDALAAAETVELPAVRERTTYKKATCARCGCGVVALEDETRPLCVDCVRVEKMRKRRQEA
ncbi:hypothetical protein MTHERMMSTA1_13500 [Methanosarcina thermophila MST-A1]|nr:hypothetical protein MTHERMMSTA1_13500 [Methanosarcina thermophila MST-A1]